MYTQTDLDAIDVELSTVERQRTWMAKTAAALRTRDCRAELAVRQEAQFAAKVQAIRDLRANMESLIAAERNRSTDGSGRPVAPSAKQD